MAWDLAEACRIWIILSHRKVHRMLKSFSAFLCAEVKQSVQYNSYFSSLHWAATVSPTRWDELFMSCLFPPHCHRLGFVQWKQALSSTGRNPKALSGGQRHLHSPLSLCQDCVRTSLHSGCSWALSIAELSQTFLHWMGFNKIIEPNRSLGQVCMSTCPIDWKPWCLVFLSLF